MPNKISKNNVNIKEKYGRPAFPVFSINKFSTNSNNISDIDCNLPGIISAYLTPMVNIKSGTIEARTINNDAFVKDIS